MVQSRITQRRLNKGVNQLHHPPQKHQQCDNLLLCKSCKVEAMPGSIQTLLLGSAPCHVHILMQRSFTCCHARGVLFHLRHGLTAAH